MSGLREKYLIINADDFGVQQCTNKAVVELYEKGLITSSSLLTVAPYSLDAVKLSAENKLPVGVHLTINSDDSNYRWQSNSNAKSLSDRSGLLSNQFKLALKARSSDVAKEIEAQYEFMVNNGCKPDHADNHCGTLYGINGRLFFINAFRFCKKYDLPFRFPKKADFLSRQLGRKAPPILVLAHRAILKFAKHYDVLLLDDMISNPFSINKIESYETLRDYYVEELKNVGPGITEMFLHPSYPIGLEPSGNENEWLKREYELRLLKSGDLLDVAAKKYITLVSWGNAPFKKNIK